MGKRAEERRERTLRVDRERKKRDRERKKREKEESNECRGSTPIVSVLTLGARTTSGRKVLGVMNDGGNRRRERSLSK